MVSKRKKRRKLKKAIKRILIAIPVLVIIVLILVYGFKMKAVGYTSDLNQYNANEIQDYLEAKKVENTLWFWLKSVFGSNDDLEMLKDYSVTLNSPMKITIHGKEKPLRSCVQFGANYFYMDERGVVLKNEPCTYLETKKKGKKLIGNSLGVIPFTNIQINGATFYQKLDTKDKEGLETIVRMTEAFDTMEVALDKAHEQYPGIKDIQIEKVDVSKDYDITLYIKGGLKVAFGKDNQLKEKMEDFVDIYGSTYEQLTKYSGTLQMQWISEDASYTFIKDEAKKKKKKK
jgi:cell division septal protein FtsQ